MNTERPLTAQEREALVHDLAGYRRLLAESRRERLFFAESACTACRRVPIILDPERARTMEGVKQKYMTIVREITAELETRIAGIRALERDLTEQVQP